MTLGKKGSPPGSTATAYLYYLPNPATGTNTVSISFTGSHNVGGQAGYYTGAEQSGTVDSGIYTATSDAAGDHSVTVNVTQANSWLAENKFELNSGAASGVNATLRSGANWGFDDNIIDSNLAYATGNQTIGFHWTATDTHVIIGVSIPPCVTAAASSLLQSYSYWW